MGTQSGKDTSWREEEGVDALISPKGDDLVFEMMARSAEDGESKLPDIFGFGGYALPSRDQGRRGTCAAFTVCFILEIRNAMTGRGGKWMSPEFVYHHRVNKPSRGMYGRDAFRILQEIGTVEESLFEYSTENTTPRRTVGKKLYGRAGRNRISGFARVVTAAGLRRALVECGPCYLLLPLFRGRPEFWRPGINESTNAAHSVAVIGYDDVGFLLKNSWGSEWNGDGCVVMGYEEWPCFYECWVPIFGEAGGRPMSVSLPSVREGAPKTRKRSSTQESGREKTVRSSKR